LTCFGDLHLRIGDAFKGTAIAPAIERGAIQGVGNGIHLPVNGVMAIGPEAAAVAAPGQVERHHASHVIGILELLVGPVWSAGSSVTNESQPKVRFGPKLENGNGFG
jgi:hypothetical protein